MNTSDPLLPEVPPVAPQTAPSPEPMPTPAEPPHPLDPETFWDKWSGLIMVLAVMVIFGLIAWFGWVTYSYVHKIQTGQRIDISSFGGTADSSILENANNDSSTANEVFVNNFADDPSIGPKDAQITVVMFEDFECPFCGKVYPILQNVISKYSGKVRFVYRDFPLSSIHPNAELAAQAGQCAQAQGKFWAFHNILYTHQSALGAADLKTYAQTAALDVTAFSKCLDSGQFVDEVAADFSDGVKAGVSGTPTFFINGNKVQGVISENGFDQIIGYFLNQQTVK